MTFDVSHPEVQAILDAALAEDIGTGDITSSLCVPAGKLASGRFVARQSMIVAGVELLEPIYRRRGSLGRLDVRVASATRVNDGDEIAKAEGDARTLLECERVALNFLQRLSGVATLAGQYCDRVAGTACRILDTRKTTPGLRRLEKMAASAGGAVNHRLGLFDAVLIKNNHITAAGGIRSALERTRNAGVPVEIEVRSLAEIDEALSCGASRLLLDNFTPADAAAAIRFIAGRASVEISGGVTLDTVRAYALTGADFISCGAITHSAPAVDINFHLDLR